MLTQSFHPRILPPWQIGGWRFGSVSPLSISLEASPAKKLLLSGVISSPFLLLSFLSIEYMECKNGFRCSVVLWRTGMPLLLVLYWPRFSSGGWCPLLKRRGELDFFLVHFQALTENYFSGGERVIISRKKEVISEQVQTCPAGNWLSISPNFLQGKEFAKGGSKVRHWQLPSLLWMRFLWFHLVLDHRQKGKLMFKTNMTGIPFGERPNYLYSFRIAIQTARGSQ